jgi:hypothetical protein
MTLIGERQASRDGDDEDGRDIEECAEEQLRRRGHDPDRETVRIPAETMADWLSALERKPISSRWATRRLNELPMRRLEQGRATSQRYWLWKRKPDAPPLQCIGIDGRVIQPNGCTLHQDGSVDLKPDPDEDRLMAARSSYDRLYRRGDGYRRG